MFEQELRLYAFMAEYCKMLTRDLTKEHYVFQPVPDVNTPMWLLGHLCVVGDGALRRLGQPPHCGSTWQENFAPGTFPNQNPNPYPDPEELLATYETVHMQVANAATTAKPEAMSEPNDIERLRPMLPTTRDLISHMLTTHEAMHLGQLSLWRRAAGLPQAV